MLASAGKLAQAGADFLICPGNTIHQALPMVEPRSPLPWLHIAEVVAERAAEREEIDRIILEERVAGLRPGRIAACNA